MLEYIYERPDWPRFHWIKRRSPTNSAPYGTGKAG